MKTLWETYETAYDHIAYLEWRIFRGNRKVCNNYGAIYENSLDDSEVIKAEVKYKKDGGKYVRVSIK